MRDHSFQERILISRGTGALELGDPEGLSATSDKSLVNIGHKVIGSAAVVPVDGHEVDLAACAGVEEVAEPGQAHGPAAVGDCWGAELRLAGEGSRHVGLVSGCCFFGGEVRLSAEIGLVEGHQVGGACCDGFGGR